MHLFYAQSRYKNIKKFKFLFYSDIFWFDSVHFISMILIKISITITVEKYKKFKFLFYSDIFWFDFVHFTSVIRSQSRYKNTKILISSSISSLV